MKTAVKPVAPGGWIRQKPGRFWNASESLALGSAMTRDGRLVLDLREAVIDDGKTIIVGNVSTKRGRSYKPGEVLHLERHYWLARGAFGLHGGDDLMTPDDASKGGNEE